MVYVGFVFCSVFGGVCWFCVLLSFWCSLTKSFIYFNSIWKRRTRIFGKFDEGEDLFFAYWIVGIFILVMMQMQIGYDANEQITSSQDVQS